MVREGTPKQVDYSVKLTTPCTPIRKKVLHSGSVIRISDNGSFEFMSPCANKLLRNSQRKKQRSIKRKKLINSPFVSMAESVSKFSTKLLRKHPKYKIRRTIPKSPILHTKHRRTHPPSLSFEEKEQQMINSVPIFRARPLNPKIFEEPILVSKIQKSVPLNPFNLPGEFISARKIEVFKDRLEQEQIQEKMNRVFVAQPFLFEHYSPKAEEKEKPFEFHAQPIPKSVYVPFVPLKSSKPLTEQQEKVLHTQLRASDRKMYDNWVQEQLLKRQEELNREQKQQNERIQEEIRLDRQNRVHKAKCVPKIKYREIQKSNQKPTQPVTPLCLKRK